jgi:hypothetical protein
MSAALSAADEHLMASLEPHPPSGGAPLSAARPRYSVHLTAAAAIANIVQSATPQKDDGQAAAAVAAAGAAAAFVPLDLSPPAVAALSTTDGLITAAASASIASSDPTTATPVPVAAIADTATASAPEPAATAAAVSAAAAPIDSGELALMADPTYAPYVAYFRRYDADASNTISQAELAPLLREVGYCFSASVVRAVLAQYYPDTTTALKFSVREMNWHWFLHCCSTAAALFVACVH